MAHKNNYAYQDDGVGVVRFGVGFILIIMFFAAATNIWRATDRLSHWVNYQKVIPVETRSIAEKWAEDCVPAGLTISEQDIWTAVCKEKAKEKFGEIEIGLSDYRNGVYKFIPYDDLDYDQRQKVLEWLRKPKQYSYRTTNYGTYNKNTYKNY